MLVLSKTLMANHRIVTEGATDKELAHVELGYIEKTYGYKHMVGHRASLASGLYEGCKKESAIKFHFAINADNVDFGSRPIFHSRAPR